MKNFAVDKHVDERIGCGPEPHSPYASSRCRARVCVCTCASVRVENAAAAHKNGEGRRRKERGDRNGKRGNAFYKNRRERVGVGVCVSTCVCASTSEGIYCCFKKQTTPPSALYCA